MSTPLALSVEYSDSRMDTNIQAIPGLEKAFAVRPASDDNDVRSSQSKRSIATILTKPSFYRTSSLM